MKHFLFTVLFSITSFSGFSFPDNAESRTALRELITAPTSDVLSSEDRLIEQFTDGSRVSFQVREQLDAFYLLFVNEQNGLFPVYSKGTFIIKRNISDGKFVQIKVFLKNDPGCYARIFPMEDRAMMDIFLYEERIYKEINLPFSFAEALTESFSEIMDASSMTVDWDLIFPEAGGFLYSGKVDLINEIRAALPDIIDADDGAIDSDGSYVFINDLSSQPEESAGLNCSGFVKWVADGLYFSNTGNYMSIEDLKNKNLSERGNRWSLRHEDERDPYFGLDWTRNIALEIAEADENKNYDYNFADVDNIPWSSYVDDIGYPIKDLKLLAYYLAVKEPEYIYLASVNIPWGTEPILQQHVHTAVIIPYIDEKEVYQDLVFERNIESDTEKLAENYENAHIHLVRIRVSPGFKLPELKKKASIGPESIFRR